VSFVVGRPRARHFFDDVGEELGFVAVRPHLPGNGIEESVGPDDPGAEKFRVLEDGEVRVLDGHLDVEKLAVHLKNQGVGAVGSAVMT
jgi:hypothetical protein